MEPPSSLTPFQTLKLVIEEASAVPEEWTNGPGALIPRKAALLTRDGMMHVISAPQGKFYLHREEGGIFRLTTQPGSLPPLPPMPPKPKGDYSWGTAAWDELHTAALTLKTPAERAVFLARFIARLPCGECKKHFEQLVAERPPRFESEEAFFEWTVVDAHDGVNANLNRPLFGLEAAREKYLHKKK